MIFYILHSYKEQNDEIVEVMSSCEYANISKKAMLCMENLFENNWSIALSFFKILTLKKKFFHRFSCSYSSIKFCSVYFCMHFKIRIFHTENAYHAFVIMKSVWLIRVLRGADNFTFFKKPSQRKSSVNIIIYVNTPSSRRNYLQITTEQT